MSAPAVTVAVVGICSASHLERCLEALARQVDAPPFDVVVVHDPHIEGMDRVACRHPAARLVANEGQRTPLELAARAVRESTGDIVILTEDHCIPRPDWVRRLADALLPGRAAAGGVVETDPEAGAVDWSFFLVDFFRYMRPVTAGPSPTLTVCNVAYRRADLEAIAPLWATIFHETAINDALRRRFGALWMVPDAEVRMRRSVRFGDAVYERYAFGRLFGCTRLEAEEGTGRRLYYLAFSPGLPLLLLGRMARKCARRPSTLLRFLRSLPATTAMVLAWSWGEWLGYLTRRRPGSLVVAPEIRAAMSSE
ncbi:MAG TPA: glycosyltransferase [Gemmatimonadaceae bacterium]|nr:glycosyltransferase [Gemmatimonadaceae bacterium]